MDKQPADYVSPTLLRLGSETLTVRSTCAETDGAMFAVEIRMPPGGGPPVMHRHDPAEVYRILEGELTFYVGDPSADVTRRTAGAGDVVTLAGGTPHTIRNESGADAVAFTVHSPGAVMEGFAMAAAALAAEAEPDLAAVLALAERHGIQMLGPVPHSGATAS